MKLQVDANLVKGCGWTKQGSKESHGIKGILRVQIQAKS